MSYRLVSSSLQRTYNRHRNLFVSMKSLIVSKPKNVFFFFFRPTFWRIFKNKSVEEFMPYPYLATVLNCVFWVLYGLPFVTPDSTLVVTINSFGLAIELLYLFIYVLYADNKGRVRVPFFTILATALRTVSTYIYIDGLICCFRK